MELFDHAKPAIFVFGSVPIAVMVTIFRGQPPARQFVEDFYLRDDLDRERKGRPPACRELLLVLQIKISRWLVLDGGPRAQMIVHLNKEVRFDTAGKIEEHEIPWTEVADIGAPQDAADSRSVKIG